MMPDGMAFVLTSSNERAGVPSAKKRFPVPNRAGSELPAIQVIGEVLFLRMDCRKLRNGLGGRPRAGFHYLKESSS